MSNIIWIISSAMIFVTLNFIFQEYKFNKNKKILNPNILKPDKIYFIIGFCGEILFLGVIILRLILDNTSSELEKFLGCGLLLIFTIGVGGYLIFFYLNYKIMVYEDYFIYQNFWRIKKTIYYKDIYIEYSKLYPQVRQKLNNGKSKLIFKLAGILNNEDVFIDTYEQWLNKHSTNENENSNS